MHNIGDGTSHWTDSFGQTVVQKIILFPCFLKVFKAVALFKDVRLFAQNKWPKINTSMIIFQMAHDPILKI